MKAIDKEMSGDLKVAYRAIVLSIIDLPKFFAERLYKAMVGVGTDDASLIRLLVGRSEIDLDDVKKIFQDTYKKSLSAWVSSECSGNYKNILLLLIGENI